MLAQYVHVRAYDHESGEGGYFSKIFSRIGAVIVSSTTSRVSL